MRPTATLLLLALVAWVAALASAGAAAMGAFATLPKIGISVAGTEAFFAGDTAEMGRHAAGRMLAPVFLLSDWVQIGASSLSVACTVRLARLRGMRGAPWARRILVACVGAAACLMAWRAWTAPGMNADLLAWWQAIADGDRAGADAARTSFDAARRIADTLHRITLGAVLLGTAAFPAALIPPAFMPPAFMPPAASRTSDA